MAKVDGDTVYQGEEREGKDWTDGTEENALENPKENWIGADGKSDEIVEGAVGGWNEGRRGQEIPLPR